MVDNEAGQVKSLVPTMFDKGAVRAWIDLLHGSSPGLIHICSVGDWAGSTFQPDEFEQAADYIEDLDAKGREGIYVRTTTLSRKLGEGERGSVEDSHMLPGFAGDIDIMGPGHKHNPARTGGRTLPPDVPTAMAIVRESGLPEPTLWVHSGGGLYPWWMLEQAWDIRELDQREMAEKLSVGIQQVLYRSALRLGWHYGAEVSDMARVLRVPGTVNRKAGGAQPCHVIDPPGYDFFAPAKLMREVTNALEELPAPEAPRPKMVPKIIVASDDIKPGDDFERKTDWADILTPAGWTYMFHRGSTIYWRRPGKDRGEHSATTGHDPLRDRLYVFSGSTEFNPNEPITKFAAYAIINHGGDYSAASRSLRGQGFGGQRTEPSYTSSLDGLIDPSAASTSVPARPTVQAPATGPDGQDDTFTPRTGKGKPIIELSSNPESIRAITAAINARMLSDVYVADGRLLYLTPASGSASSNGKPIEKRDSLDIEALVVSADTLAAILSAQAYVYKIKAEGSGEDKKLVQHESTPTATVLRAVLSQTWWPGVPVLRGIVGSPVLRPDGSLMQAPGYDEQTGLYYRPTVSIPTIADKPTAKQVKQAKDFVIEKVFGEFCWSSKADLANYLALLVSPILRPYLQSLTPFGIISATTPGSGKTNLVNAIGLLYGQAQATMPDNDAEFRKMVTSTLMDKSCPVVIFDNLSAGLQIDSTILAKLITGEHWTDRILGASKMTSQINDRLWLATGNGLTVGGDMATRSIIVQLDPRMARPELRKFDMGQFSDWIDVEENRTDLLVALLTLIRAWIEGGASRAQGQTMRGFTGWAQAMGGLLKFHGIEGFLENSDELRELDADEEEWTVFVTKWNNIFGNGRRTASALHKSQEDQWAGGVINPSPWGGAFITGADGKQPNPKSLGKLLHGRRGRFYGGFAIRCEHNKTTNSKDWWVEKTTEGNTNDSE